MKARLFGDEQNVRPELWRRTEQKGSSTLEILIAFAILTLSITAVILVGFSNQSISVDSQTNNEGIYRAQSILEVARAQSRKDFLSVVSTTTIATSTIAFKQILTVEDITQCKKQATSTVSWLTGSRTQTISLVTQLIDVAGALALGSDCQVSPPIGGWKTPHSLLSRDFQKIPGDNPAVNSSGGLPATDIDVLDKKIYMTAIAATKDNFYIFDASNVMTGVKPPILGSFSTGPGLNKVDVVGNYAYVANASSTNTQSSDEFMVINVSTPSAPSVAKSISLGIVPNCPLYCPGGAQAIYYYNGSVYVGTHRIGGDEFHVFSVSSPYSPTAPHFLGSVELDTNVNDIIVRGNYAYIATSVDTKEVKVLNISNPGVSIPETGFFEAKNSDGTLNDKDGTALFLIGTKLFLGREKVNKNASEQRDFYIIDITDPTAPKELGSANLQYITGKNFSAGAMVTSIYVTSKYAFIATNDSDPGFIVLDISDPSAINAQSGTPQNKVISTFNYSNYNTGIDFSDGFIYTSNSQNDTLRIIIPAECADKIDNDSDSKIDSADPQCHTDGNANNATSYDAEDDSE